MWRIRVRLMAGSMRATWGLFAASRIGLLGLAIIVLYGAMAIAHPILMRWVWDPRIFDPVVGYSFDEVRQPAPPSSRHLLGTDPLGRDVLSQLMYSARTEFALGLIAAGVTLVLGTAVGVAAAYFRGVVDAVLMRLADLVIMLPALSFLIVMAALFDLDFLSLAVIIGILSGFGAVAVIIKSQALVITVKPFIEAARAAGGSHLHIIMTHLVPNLIPLALLYMMFTVTAAIFSEAVLSFFGILNVRMTWGLMIHTTQFGGYLLGGFRFWWLLMPAGVSITLLCGSFYLVGRAMDEIVNPRLRRS
jgi:peptide/nickel transport system permease protein